MKMKTFLISALAVFSTAAYAELDDYFELDEDMTAEFNTELSQEVDVYFAHRDWYEGKDAPLIQFTVYTVEEHGVDFVGSYNFLADAMRGKSDKFKLLMVEYLAEIAHESSSQVSRVSEYELFDDYSALMFIVDYADDADNVYQQFQIMQWAQDGAKKCVFASDVSERVASFYEDSITDALVELMAYCAVGLNTDDLKEDS